MKKKEILRNMGTATLSGIMTASIGIGVVPSFAQASQPAGSNSKLVKNTQGAGNVVIPNNDNSKMILNAKSGKGTIAKDINFIKPPKKDNFEPPNDYDFPKEKVDSNLGESITMERVYRVSADPGYIIKRINVDGKTEYTDNGENKTQYDFRDKVTGHLTHENTLDINYPDHTFDVWFEKLGGEDSVAPNDEPGQQKLFTITVKPVDQNWSPLAEEQFQDMDISGQQGYVNHTKVRPNDNTNVSEFMLGLMQMKGYLNILPNEGQELIGVYNPDKSQLELTDDNDPFYVSGGYKSYKIENLLKGEPRDIVLYAMVKKDKDIDPPSQEEYFTYSDNTKTTIKGLTDAGKKMLKDNGGKLVIPKGVREIGYRAFDKTKITLLIFQTLLQV